MKINKFNYIKVIQQHYGASYGYEEVSEYEVNSLYCFKTNEERRTFKNDLKEYRLTGHSTRVINRKQLK